MADILSIEARSRNMSAIKSKNTSPEIFLRKCLFALGYRYRKNVSYISGHPDLYFAKYHTAIFVHGCYWHRHEGCKFSYTPKSHIDFWTMKFENNIRRDQTVKNTLLNVGTRILVVWECTLKKMKNDNSFKASVLDQIENFLESDERYLEV